MGYPKEHKSKTRQRIIESAYRLFTSKGYAATSIDEIMRGCELTRGGFYAHFASKSQLYHEAIAYATSRIDLLESQLDRRDETTWISLLLNSCMHPSGGECASRLAFFGRDLASRETAVRSAYTMAFKLIGEKLLGHDARIDEDCALSLAAMIIGTVAIAQTTDDADLRARLLTACSESAKALLEHMRECLPPTFFWAANEEARAAGRGMA